MSTRDPQKHADEATKYFNRLIANGIHHTDAIEMTRSYIGVTVMQDRMDGPKQPWEP